MAQQNKVMTGAGWALTGLVSLMLTFSAVMKLMNTPDVAKEMVGRLGYPDDVVFAIGIVEIGCLAVYLFPRTAILGAVLLTGYLGGATATHVRVHDSFVPPVIGGVLVWLAVYLRDARVRALLPIRLPLKSPEAN
ncbi:MAG TPA: DoxX family protein [Pirellulales bacterium]|nr:DoxX family protein [Pirellulales bacterium]